MGGRQDSNCGNKLSECLNQLLRKIKSVQHLVTRIQQKHPEFRGFEFIKMYKISCWAAEFTWKL